MKKRNGWLFLLLASVGANSAYADIEYIETTDKSFVGILDIQARYGGHDEWVQAASAGSGRALAFEITEKWPFRSETKRIKAHQFSLLEVAYEFPAVLVYQRNDNPTLKDWVRVKIDGELTWLRMEPGDEYDSYTSLFDHGRLGYLLGRSVELSDRPAGKSIPRTFKPQDQNAADFEGWTPEVEVIGRANITEFDDQTGKGKTNHWLKIRVGDKPSCSGPGDDEVTYIVEGWVPAYRKNGDIAVWFYSRGC